MTDFPEELSQLKERAKAASGVSWRAGTDPTEGRVVEVHYRDGGQQIMSLKRDQAPANEDDVEFVAHSRDDVLRLTSALEGSTKLTALELDEIEERTRRASPAPWRPFLETDGGMAGTNVIWVTHSDNEADLYLWIGNRIAPGPDFEFVAAARNEMPRLLAAVRQVQA